MPAALHPLLPLSPSPGSHRRAGHLLWRGCCRCREPGASMETDLSSACAHRLRAAWGCAPCPRGRQSSQPSSSCLPPSELPQQGQLPPLIDSRRLSAPRLQSTAGPCVPDQSRRPKGGVWQSRSAHALADVDRQNGAPGPPPVPGAVSGAHEMPGTSQVPVSICCLNEQTHE